MDSSAVLAIILDEPEALRFSDAIAEADSPRIPAPNWVEVAIVIEARADAVLRQRFDAFAARLGVTVAPFAAAHAASARTGWLAFGRGRPKAKLNYGDCMAYGFARAENQPLLFKGGDFALTDIEPALKG